MTPIKGKRYKVTWIDAAGSAAWTDEKELDDMIAMYEKGVEQVLAFIKESKRFYPFTSGTHIGDQNYCDVMLIPKEWAKLKQFK